MITCVPHIFNDIGNYELNYSIKQTRELQENLYHNAELELMSIKFVLNSILLGLMDNKNISHNRCLENIRNNSEM